jgi:quinone-modifying oxidoreductase subunit QmoC
MLTLFGFAAALLTAFGGAVLENGFGVPSPLPNPNAPSWAFCVGSGLKILGILGAVGLLGGSGWMLYRRLFQQEEVGATSFFDGVFLWMLFGTGLSGTMVYVARISECGTVGYPLFFLHLSLVALLLSTMGYTKFAHVFYRTTAMTFTLHVGRSVDNEP